MRAVKDRNSRAEMTVRRLIHGMGFRYRLHWEVLPGRPDIVFTKRRKVIFVHGCFWHGHKCRRGNRMPKANRSYWTAKLTRNRERDMVTISSLCEAGWDVLVIWECQTKAGNQKKLQSQVLRFLQESVSGREETGGLI